MATTSSTDAASTLLQSLTTKIERVQTSILDNAAILQTKQKQLQTIHQDIEKLEIEENRINEYLNTLGEPDWSRLCTVTPPEAIFTIQIISSPSNALLTESTYAYSSSSSSSSSSPTLMTVGLPDTKHILNGKMCTVGSVGSARCLAGYLRSNTFIPPSNENEILEVFHLANDYHLDELSTLIKEFLLSNLQQ